MQTESTGQNTADNTEHICMSFLSILPILQERGTPKIQSPTQPKTLYLTAAITSASSIATP